MAKYRIISPKIWNDAKFRDLSDKAKLVFFMLLTHPHTSAIGTIRAYTQGLAAELNWPDKAFQEAFQEGLNKGLWKADIKAGLIWLPNFIKYNLPQSPNVLKSWVGAFEDCPECELKNQVFSNIKSLSESLSEAFGKAFREAFRDPLPNQEQDSGFRNQEQDQDLNTSCSEQTSGSDQQEILQVIEIQFPPPKIFIKLPLIDGSEFPITVEDVNKWQGFFPAVDIEQEFRNMNAWLFANEKRRKTKGGINRFIQGWLAKKQNNPGSNSHSGYSKGYQNNINKTQQVIDEQSRIMREIFEEKYGKMENWDETGNE